MRRLNHKHTVGAAGIIILLFGCMDSSIYHSQQSIKDNCWMRTDTLSFPLAKTKDVIKTAQVEMRVRSRFAYRSLTLVVESSNKNQIQRDTVNIPITNEENNKVGKQLFWEQLSSQPLTYHKGFSPTLIRLYHIMKNEQMKEITEVGIHLQH